jgi:hypothetical protein
MNHPQRYQPAVDTVLGRLKALLNCSCGHTMTVHDWEGCHGTVGNEPCTCKQSDLQALDAAIDSMGGSPYKPAS